MSISTELQDHEIRTKSPAIAKFTRFAAKAVTLSVMAVYLTGCAGDDAQNQNAGALLGGIFGALLGSTIGKGSGKDVAIAAGAIIGSAVGSEIGRSMDKQDRLEHARATNESLGGPVGETIVWTNPESGNSGAVTSMREGTATSGSYCREYRQEVTIGG